MNRLSGFPVYLALSLLAACSTFEPEPTVADCPAVEAPSCPVCAPAEPAVQECPEPQIVEKIVKVPAPAPAPPKAATAGKLGLPIVGAVEWANVEPGDIRMPARVDTGASTTSIHAEDIQLVEKDGKRWVHFTLQDPKSKEKVSVEQRLRRTVLIRSGDGQEQRRYVVQLWISLGDIRSRVDVTLTDRDHMEYPSLIGRNLLMDNLIVDVSRQNELEK